MIQQNCIDKLRSFPHRIMSLYIAKRLIPEYVKKLMVDQPGHPIVANSRSITEPLSQFLDWYLRPLLSSVQPYSRGNNMLLQDLDKLIVDEKCLLPSGDVAGFFSYKYHGVR